MDKILLLLSCTLICIAALLVVRYYRKKDAIIKSDLLDRIEKIQRENTELSLEKSSLRQKYEELAELYKSYKQEFEIKEQKLRERIELEISKGFASQKELAIADQKMDFLEEQYRSEKLRLEELENRFKNEFQLLSQQLLDENSKKFTQQNKAQIDQVLLPLSKQIIDFKELVEKSYSTENNERISLKKEVELLVKQTREVSDSADQLSNALKTNKKIQGNWGELILENMLNDAGLVEGQMFFKQQSYKDASGKILYPDVVVKYPDGKKIVVDSKVSLNDYANYVNASNDEDQKAWLQNHLDAVKKHIDGLSSKNYEQVVDGVDFVMMFMPIEPAYLIVLNQHADLWSYAYKKKIVLVGPSNLLISLKIIQEVWQKYNQTKNAEKIAEVAGKLFDKFVGFTNDMNDIGLRIKQLEKAYDGASNKLTTGRGSVVSLATKMKNLGAKTTKDLPSNYDIVVEDSEALSLVAEPKKSMN